MRLEFEQNLPLFEVAGIVLQAPSKPLEYLKPLVPSILKTLPEAPKGAATLVKQLSVTGSARPTRYLSDISAKCFFSKS